MRFAKMLMPWTTIHPIPAEAALPIASYSPDQPRPLQSWTKPILWGVGFGLFQAFSPVAFWWLAPVVVWSLALVLLASVYIGFAVADGRTVVVAVEVGVASAFVIMAAVAIKFAPWLVVIALVAHGLKDAWQERTHFVANTRWWPPFCLVVDFVAAALTALLLLTDNFKMTA
jgi:hypothetical protein